MLDLGAPPAIAILVVVTIVVGVALPILVARRTARREDMRELILLSRPGRVEATCIGVIVVQSLGAVVFAAIAVIAQPILWVIVACSASSVVASALHLHRFRRALRALEAEIAAAPDAGGDDRV